MNPARHQGRELLPEPYRIKMVEPLRIIPPEARKKAVREAGYNTFLLRSRDIYIDLLTDSGTNAMSDAQWSAMMMGDEAYAGSQSYFRLVEAVQSIYGYRYVIPTHQGRGAEHILSRCLIRPGSIVPGNMYFTTTRLHQELAGGGFADVIVDEAYDPQCDDSFKGNIDLRKLENLTKKVSAPKIAYVAVGAPVNMAGGQPVSMENMRQVSAFCRKRGIPLVLDAARAVENAYFIQQREPGYGLKPVRDILREMCSLTDICTMSAKKDAFANIGGFLAMNDASLYEEAKNLCVVYEGLHTYGGLAGRDLEALAQGIRESVERDDWIAHRISQVQYLWRGLKDAGIPVVHPCGGHAVFVDAQAFLPHIPQKLLPAQTLAAAIYADSGVRSMERGIVSAGRDAATKQDHAPELELVRLTLPRRVYTQTHLDYVSRGVRRTFQRRDSLCGLKFVYEPKYLRFFQARFAPVPKAPSARRRGRPGPRAGRRARPRSGAGPRPSRRT
ncbi:MAG: tyrosine phenol-lyase [Elusimicrobia bacterium]|nr:tyrosine phenol-lyase [Elusimicrobiota bacterium]